MGQLPMADDGLPGRTKKVEAINQGASVQKLLHPLEDNVLVSGNFI
jgi:hypothetical protein